MSFENLLKKCKKPQSTIVSRVACVTTAFAAGVVADHNKRNRPYSKGLAAIYANEFLRGKWKLNGEPLIFDTDGQCVSGQHRLHGFLMAQQALESGQVWPDAQSEFDCVIVSGVAPETADSVDTGKGRNHADVLFRSPLIDELISADWNKTASRRKKWVTCLATAARLVWLLEGGQTVSDAVKFLHSEMLRFLEVHRNLAKFVTIVLDAKENDGGYGGLKISLAYIAALGYAWSIDTTDALEYDVVKVDADLTHSFTVFVEKLANGKDCSKGSICHAVSGYWNTLFSEGGSKDRDREIMGPFIKALNLLSSIYHGDTDKGKKPSDIKLTNKERENWTECPIALDGWHGLCVERAARIKADAAAAKETPPEPEPEPATTPARPAKKRPAKKCAAATLPDDDGGFDPDGEDL